ncbi:MAG: hypothetical protein COB15_12070 [Flavobacteriales bacterium]|nr:MAG: hypothetical protein COB15_12070 [Flavobacteriales bacterium]
MEDRVEKINKQLKDNTISQQQHDDLYKAILGSAGGPAREGDAITTAMLDRIEKDQMQKLRPFRVDEENRKLQIKEIQQTAPGELEETTAEKAKSGKLDPLVAMVMGYLESARAAPDKKTSDEILLGLQALFIQYGADANECRAIYNWMVCESYGTKLSHFPNGVLYAKSSNPKTVTKYQDLNEATLAEFIDFQTTLEGAGPGAEPRFTPSTFAKKKDGFRMAKAPKISGLAGGGSIPIIETPQGYRADTTEVEQALNGQQKEIKQLKQEIANFKKNANRNRNQDHGYEDRGGGRGRGRGDRGRGRGAWRARGGGEQQEEDSEGQPHTQPRQYFH